MGSKEGNNIKQSIQFKETLFDEPRLYVILMLPDDNSSFDVEPIMLLKFKFALLFTTVNAETSETKMTYENDGMPTLRKNIPRLLLIVLMMKVKEVASGIALLLLI